MLSCQCLITLFFVFFFRCFLCKLLKTVKQKMLFQTKQPLVWEWKCTLACTKTQTFETQPQKAHTQCNFLLKSQFAKPMRIDSVMGANLVDEMASFEEFWEWEQTEDIPSKQISRRLRTQLLLLVWIGTPTDHKLHADRTCISDLGWKLEWKKRNLGAEFWGGEGRGIRG